MRKIIVFIGIVLFSLNLKSQVKVGFNFNVCNSYIQNTKIDEHFSVPYGLNIGYNVFNKLAFDMSFFSDRYIFDTGEENIYYQFPIAVSKIINSNESNFYYKIGFLYSSSIIQSRQNENFDFKNYFVSGPGFMLSAGLKFDRYQIEISGMNMYEMFGSGRKREQALFFISSNFYLFKK